MAYVPFTAENALAALTAAERRNPGPWGRHSRFVAKACRLIAEQCYGLDAEKAYLLGLLHDIGRREGVTSERHMLDGYRFCKRRGWHEAAQICVTHSFMIQDLGTSIGVFDMTAAEKEELEAVLMGADYTDYDRLLQLCDSLALPNGFCLLEKRFVDTALRYGTFPATAERWKKNLEIKTYFEEQAGGSIYDLLPGVRENTFRED